MGTLMFTEEQAKAAKTLAIAYQGYHEALGVYSRDNSLVVYGEMLVEAQERTGVTLNDSENVLGLVSLAKARLKQAAEQKVIDEAVGAMLLDKPILPMPSLSADSLLKLLRLEK